MTHLFKDLEKTHKWYSNITARNYILEKEQNIAYPYAKRISIRFDMQSFQIWKTSEHIAEDHEPNLLHPWGEVMLIKSFWCKLWGTV